MNYLILIIAICAVICRNFEKYQSFVTSRVKVHPRWSHGCLVVEINNHKLLNELTLKTYEIAGDGACKTAAEFWCFSDFSDVLLITKLWLLFMFITSFYFFISLALLIFVVHVLLGPGADSFCQSDAFYGPSAMSEASSWLQVTYGETVLGRSYSFGSNLETMLSSLGE